MVDGSAGSGKSRTIDIVREFIQLIMQQPGDDPDCPHVLLCAPTGSAAVNINGSTLHSTFGFTFGNEHYSLPDKKRDSKRSFFKNVKFLLIDEISMVRADQLYQLDLRLREVTMRPNQLFGGISVYFFGDILQLRPVMGRYIWCQPQHLDYLQAFLVQSHWEQFRVISLLENHRQSEDALYADILNRIRTGEHTEDDLNVLENRVRPEGHPDLKGALVIACKHVDVNRHNTICLSELNTELITIKSVNSHANLRNFKQKIDKKKLTIGPTPYLETLYLKVGSRVMLTINLDVKDGLCNGSIGTLMAAVKDENGAVGVLLVMFDDQRCGREMRRCHPQLIKKCPGCTPIKKQIHKYSTSKSCKGPKMDAVIVQQFIS